MTSNEAFYASERIISTVVVSSIKKVREKIIIRRKKKGLIFLPDIISI